nr:2,4-dihydroxyhept-2-ene-1,7-dioic acid aldolase [uncultured bacterium]
MKLIENRFKHAIAAGKQQVGLWVSLASTYSAEIVAGAGFDWLLFDGEHSPNDPPTMITQLQVAAAFPVSSVVRPAWNDKVLIKRYLDAGAQSLLIPYVQTVEEAQAAVAAVRYPPHGVRGVASTTRAAQYARVPDYFKRAHEEICLLVQIETRQGLDNLEAIAKVPGVDGVFIGPADLAAGLGHLGDQMHAEVQSAIEHAIKQTRACGKPAGILTPDEATARKYMSWGSVFTAVGLDIAILARETEKLAAKFKVSA